LVDIRGSDSRQSIEYAQWNELDDEDCFSSLNEDLALCEENNNLCKVQLQSKHHSSKCEPKSLAKSGGANLREYGEHPDPYEQQTEAPEEQAVISFLPRTEKPRVFHQNMSQIRFIQVIEETAKEKEMKDKLGIAFERRL
jgi:hypothetical protein